MRTDESLTKAGSAAAELSRTGFAWLVLVVLVVPRAHLAGGGFTRRPILFS
jgi:hypothetical protein